MLIDPTDSVEDFLITCGDELVSAVQSRRYHFTHAKGFFNPSDRLDDYRDTSFES